MHLLLSTEVFNLYVGFEENGEADGAEVIAVFKL